MENQSSRINQFVDNRLFEAYRSSVEYFGNKDLVLVFDESKSLDPVDAYERNRIIEDPDIPDFLKNKLCKPANDAAGKLSHSEIAFWLVVFFVNGESGCAAVKTTLMAPSSTV